MSEREVRTRRKAAERDEDVASEVAGMPEAQAPATSARRRGTAAAVLSGRADALARLEARRAGGDAGEAAPSDVRSAVEAATGRGLGHVRVHRDAEAQAIARALDARAVTVGGDVLLGDAAPSAGTREGWSLMAHELAHAAQAPAASGPVTLGARRAGPEIEAGRVAEAAVTSRMGLHAGFVGVSSESGLVARRDDPPTLAEVFGAIAALQNGQDPGPLTRRTEADGDVIRWGGLEMRTFDQVAAVFRQMGAGVTTALDGITLAADAQARAAEFQEAMQSWADMYSRTPSERVGSGSFTLLTQWREEYLAVHRSIASARQAAARRELEAHRTELRARRRELAAAEERARENLRATFMSGDESAIENAAQQIGLIVDAGLDLDEMAREIGRAISDLGGPTMLPAGRYVGYLNRLNNLIAVVQLFYVATRAAQPTELRAAATHINDLGTIFGAGGTLLSLAPHISMYGNFYLQPMLQIISNQLVHLGELLHEQNRDAVEFDPGLGRWGVEPGGRPMYDFMSTVMQAEASSALADPPTDVATYFFDQRSGFQAATGSAVPIQGMYGFRSLDLAAFKTWVFAHRDRVWAALYGSWRPPTRGRGTVRRSSKPGRGNAQRGMAALSDLLAAGGGGGAAPPDDVRRAVERASGRSLAGVRVHSGDAVSQIASDLDARAFTVGGQVFVGSGAPAPSSAEGWGLLAHELAHATQSAGPARTSLALGELGASAEHEADRLAEAAASTQGGAQRASVAAAQHDAGVIRRAPVATTESATAAPTFSRARSFSDLIQLVSIAETLLMAKGQDVWSVVHTLRGIFYGTQWSMDHGVEGSAMRDGAFQAYTASQTPDDPRPILGESLVAALRDSAEVADPGGRSTDVGHLLIGLDARDTASSNIPFPSQGGTGMAIVTWLGDLGGGAGMLAMKRGLDGLTTKPALDHFKGSDYGAPVNLEGDVAGVVGVQIMPGQTLTGALASYLSSTKGDATSRWSQRAKMMLESLGGKVSGGTLTNQASLVQQLADQIEDFGCWYATTRLLDKGKALTGTGVRNVGAHLHGASAEIAEIFVATLVYGLTHPDSPLDAKLCGSNPQPSPPGTVPLKLEALAKTLDYGADAYQKAGEARRGMGL